MPNTSGDSLQLNLGSGRHPVAGYVNVDKEGSPDLVWDLESFPWPWQDGSVREVRMNHVLEHLGAGVKVYFGIWKEMYRVCRHGASVFITVPHPRHDSFTADPTHVRAVGPDAMQLLSRRQNEAWVREGCANLPLALQLRVDFEAAEIRLDLEEPWLSQARSGRLTHEQVVGAMRQYNNVVKQIRFHLRVVKQ